MPTIASCRLKYHPIPPIPLLDHNCLRPRAPEHFRGQLHLHLAQLPAVLLDPAQLPLRGREQILVADALLEELEPQQAVLHAVVVERLDEPVGFAFLFLALLLVLVEKQVELLKQRPSLVVEKSAVCWCPFRPGPRSF